MNKFANLLQLNNNNDDKGLNNINILLRFLSIINICFLISIFVTMCFKFDYSNQKYYVLLTTLQYILCVLGTYKLRNKYSTIIYCCITIYLQYYLIHLFGTKIGYHFSIMILLMIIFYDTSEKFSKKIICNMIICIITIVSYCIVEKTGSKLVVSFQDAFILSLIYILYVSASLTVLALFYYRKFATTEASLIEYMNELEEAVNRDPLTKILNRRGLYKEYNKVKSNNMTVVMCDIDFFKKVNDTYGHDCGDEVLKLVANKLSDIDTKDKIVSRWGGEEFLIILFNINHNEAISIIENVRANISNTVVKFEEHKMSITLSFGIIEHSKDNKLDDDINRADEKLYYSKTNGRNRVTY